MYNFEIYQGYVADIGMLLLIETILILKLQFTPGFGKNENWIKKMLAYGILCAISDALCIILPKEAGRFILYMANTLFFVSFTGACYYLFSYCDNLFKPQSKFRKWSLALPIGLIWLLMLVSYWTGWFFWVNESGEYSRGPFYMTAYVILLLIYVVYPPFLSLYRLLNKRNKDKKKQLLNSIKYSLPLLAGLVLQMEYQGIPFCNIGFAISFLLIVLDNQSSLYDEALAKAHKASEYATKANAAKTDFLSRMSHDLRTPINGIAGMIHIIEKNIDDKEKVLSNLKDLKSTRQQLDSLINDMLDINRIEHGKIELSHEPFNLKTLMDGIEPSLSLRAKDNNITFIPNHYMCEHTWFIGSSLHVSRIMMNVLSNAVKYNREGGKVESWIEEKSIDDSHSSILLTVKDTGIGMSEEFLNRIFLPFEREDTKETSEIEGNGLGMSILKEFLDAMDGEISIDSKLEEGTIVHITLPLEVCLEQVFNENLIEQQTTLTGKHILLVEDNKINMKIAQTILKDANFTIDSAINGQMAVDTFEQSAPDTYDFILMDIRMPIMDGLEATRRIRQSNHKNAKTIPIIAMSANSFKSDIEECIQVGMNGHIAKPIDPEKLVSQIASYIT